MFMGCADTFIEVVKRVFTTNRANTSLTLVRLINVTVTLLTLTCVVMVKVRREVYTLFSHSTQVTNIGLQVHRSDVQNHIHFRPERILRWCILPLSGKNSRISA